MNDEDKIIKSIEAALVCAAQDGLDAEELGQVKGAIGTLPIVAPALQEIMVENEVGSEDIDLSGESTIEAISKFVENLGDNLDKYSLTELDDSYAEEVAEAIGNSGTLQNLCMGMAMAFCAGDGEISDLESNSISTLLSKMDLVMPELAADIAKRIINATVE